MMECNRRDFLIALGLLSTSTKFMIDTFKNMHDEKIKAKICYEYPNYEYPIKCNTLFEKLGPAESIGSATAYKDYIITAAHVVYQTEVEIQMSGGILLLPDKVLNRETYIGNHKLETLIINTETDIALFKNPGLASLQDKKINTNYDVGDVIYTISNPRGRGIAVRKGMIMDNNGLQDFDKTNDCYGIDVQVVSGDSGGAVFNLDGEYIGMITISTGFGGYVKKADQILKTMNEIRGVP